MVRQARCVFRVVGDDGVIRKLHARLHDNRNDALECFVQSLFVKRRAKRSNRRVQILWRCDGERVFVFGCAAGNRHLAADHIDRFRALLSRALGNRAEPRRTLGDGLVRQRLVGRVVLEAHAGVQMDLAKACAHKRVDEHLRLRHSLCLRLVAPGQRAEVISAEDQLLFRQANLLGKRTHIGREILGLHAGISAVLIHLICGGLNEHRASAGEAELHRRFDDKCVGAAYAANSVIKTGFLSLYQI